MKKLLATVALVGLCANAASAAELKSSVAGSTYNWSGVYGGVDLGFAKGDLSAIDETQPSGGFFTDLVPAGTEGFRFHDTNIAGGAHLGAQFQWQQWVFGAETSWTLTGVKKTIVSPYFPDSDTETGKLDQYVTAVGRIGYAFGRTLIYAKAGYAGGNVDFKARDNDALVTYRKKDWQSGYAVGGGVDYALTNSLILGLDYTHIDLGSSTSTGNNVFDSGALGANPETYKTNARADALMVRLTYKFSSFQ